MAKEIKLAEEPKITVLKIEPIECKGEKEKDSPIAYWLCNIIYLTFRSIKPTQREGQILVEDISDKHIQTGRYSIVSQNFKSGLPLFKKAIV